jgi:hypothetical protein
VWHGDAVFDLGSFGRFPKGPSIVAGLRELAQRVPDQHHYRANPRLVINANEGAGLIAFSGLIVPVGQPVAAIGGIHHDRYDRRDDRWTILERTLGSELLEPDRRLAGLGRRRRNQRDDAGRHGAGGGRLCHQLGATASPPPPISPSKA